MLFAGELLPRGLASFAGAAFLGFAGLKGSLLRAMTFSTAASIAAHLGERTTGSMIVRLSMERSLNPGSDAVKALVGMDVRYQFPFSASKPTPTLPLAPRDSLAFALPRHP